ncbi:MAG TPA: SRPBCC domain-containing protein [Candidatus Acidoferrales bacterium]|nr:SRPBCC domain-containing protein [Candidatus Acidoferrales bacterium]
MKTKTLRQSATFGASTHEVYESLMDSKKHTAFSGAKASISRKVGGKISAYSGWIEGKNLELVKDRLIVQEWRGADWPEGLYSITTFKISKKGSGAKLEFTQKGVPLSKYKEISAGWKEHYWAKMKLFLES